MEQLDMVWICVRNYMKHLPIGLTWVLKAMLDRLGKYMEVTPIEHGRDGNMNSMINAAAKFEQIRQSYKGAFLDMKQEQESSVRGGAGLAYDQL